MTDNPSQNHGSDKPVKQRTDKQITPRAEDFSEWYLDVIAAADLAEHSPVRGCMIIKPYGYAIWERVQQVLDAEFKRTGVENAYFPLFIPEKLLKREEQHVEGFAPEVAVVTHAGGKELEEPLVVRPTSETIMYEVFSNWIHSYRDLPLLINQWANVVRWEMKVKLFLRTTEFLWQEGHTVHATDAEADARARQMLEVYQRFSEDYMAIPVITGRKTESEKFAGALHTYSCEAMMQDGKALQYATSHHLGQNFAKPFNVTFLDENNETQYGWQTSWGLSTRSIGGLIMTHSDDKGLVLPPKMASVQVIITTIAPNPEAIEVTKNAAEQIVAELRINDVLVKIDNREIRPGEKFFEWEKKGVPLRLELGPKDVSAESAVLVRRDTGEKTVVKWAELSAAVQSLLVEIQANLFNTAKSRLETETVLVSNMDEFTAAIEAGKFVSVYFSGDAEQEKQIKAETGATSRCIPFATMGDTGKCFRTGQDNSPRTIFAKAY